jgi:lysozyme
MDRAKLIDTLELVDEGFRPRLYLDKNGIPTIGIGRNLRDNGVTKGEAYNLVNNDIDEVLANLDQNLPWWRTMNGVRQNVLANMCFQMGIHNLLEFHTTLACMKVGDYEGTANAMLKSKWATEDSPSRAHRLAEEMRKGIEYVASNT